MNQKEVMIIAAEASSVLYAQRLLEYWKAQGENIHAFGVGDARMEALGFERFGKAEEMAVVGISEIISHYSELKAVFLRLVEEAKKRKPRVVILMDYPGFNLKLAKEMHALGIPVVYYISPQVWAWKKGRVETIRKYCKKVFVLFPFEKKFYDEKGVANEFVGHPILDELDEKYFDPQYLKVHRNRCGIQDGDVVLGLMPGSRRLELAQHMDTQLDVARQLYKKVPNLKILMMVAPTFTKDQVREKMESFGLPYILLKDEPFEMIHLADVILAASGTATLMVGLLEKPMVVMYRMKWLTGIIAKIVVRGVKFFGIVNLILDKEAVPERWQEGANPDELSRLLLEIIENPERKNSMLADLKTLKTQLGDKGATVRVAKGLEEYLQA